MTLVERQRVRGGWGEYRKTEVSPDEAKRIVEQVRASQKSAFDATPIGEWYPIRFYGTLTELFQAGLE